MLRKVTTVVLVCLGLSACYLGDSGTKLMQDLKDMNDKAIQESSKK
ncbi:exported hypothetical protein [Rhodospirillaceae bacterium LM-1]|nr:exported hypothetical protein [Rhodospirillaceae bacterium LM-1]